MESIAVSDPTPLPRLEVSPCIREQVLVDQRSVKEQRTLNSHYLIGVRPLSATHKRYCVGTFVHAQGLFVYIWLHTKLPYLNKLYIWCLDLHRQQSINLIFKIPEP